MSAWLVMQAEESWVPHLLGFILPIITIAGIYQGGYWAFSGFVYALGICLYRLFAPERAPVRGEVSTRAWNGLLFSHAIIFYACIAVLYGEHT